MQMLLLPHTLIEKLKQHNTLNLNDKHSHPSYIPGSVPGTAVPNQDPGEMSPTQGSYKPPLTQHNSVSNNPYHMSKLQQDMDHKILIINL